MEDMIFTCSNCGAEIKKSDAKCPFCGYINEEGAERKYMDRLYDLRNELDVVDEEAAAEYGKGYGKILKMILITLAILALFTGIGFAIYGIATYRRINAGLNNSDAVLKEMAWKKEAFPEFDRLYEAGDYEKMCQAVFSQDKGQHRVYDWQHYKFANLYNNYLMTIDDLDHVDKNGWRDYEAAGIFYRCCLCYYDEGYKAGRYQDKLTDDELERIQPVIEYMTGILHDRLGFTDEDMAGLKDTIIDDYDVIDYTNCSKIGKEHMSQYK